MSKFLNKLNECIDSFEYSQTYSTRALINSLGNNAKRLLEIGIVQDDLVKLGFHSDGISRSVYMFPTPLLTGKIWLTGIEVYFNEEGALVKARDGVFLYTSPTWQEDLINQVKKLVK